VQIPILYRKPGDEQWFHSRVVNMSESGVLFGPTGLAEGTVVEVMFTSPIHGGPVGAGNVVCAGRVVRTTETGAAATRFQACHFFEDQ
jgi:hypothetical protein